MTNELRKQIEKDLTIFNRQKEKLLQHIEETKAYIEELTTQIEQYPNDIELSKVLSSANHILAAKYQELATINSKIEGANYMLED